MMRRTALQGVLASSFSALGLIGCGGAPTQKRAQEDHSSATKVHVLGTIHGRHRTSAAYSLPILEAAIMRAKPDVILTEIPPERVEAAFETFNATGEVDEPRTKVFPEYTDVVIPLARPQGWRVLGTAAWTPEIARARRAALDAIRNDPLRAAQWSEHRAAMREFAEKTRGRSDDPRFIHTSEFDQLVAKSREPYARFFDADLGAGGWTQINEGHNALVSEALDLLSEQGLNVLITFGTAHKYKILENLHRRPDVIVKSAASLFV
ncbi:MAG: hypothetical protein AAF291_01490 [Pseudomonadota bacterium]